MAENAGNTPPAKRVALSLLDDEWDDWAPEPGTLLYDLFGGEYESEEDVQPAEAAGAVAQANEREHDLDSHNMDEIISLSGLSDCFGMSDDEAGSACGGMGGSARVVTKSDSAYLLDAVALASAIVDARGACMLGLNDDLGSYPDMWVKDSGAYPHMVADSDSFVEYEQLAPPVETYIAERLYIFEYEDAHQGVAPLEAPDGDLLQCHTGMKQAMMMSEHASSDQHFNLYATLIALLPKELLDVIRRHLNDNATSGGQAEAALRTRFEGGHLGRISDMYAVLQSGQQRTETAEAYYHRLDNAFLDLVAEAEEHEDVEAPSHNQVVTQFLAGLRPEYEPIIDILQVTAEHEGRAITWEGASLKLAQNYSKRIEKNHASEPSAEGYIASGGTKRSAHLAT
eukprot:jgi/Tetstr1/445361/TSEL_033159.t1